jgi:AsmA protein
VGGGGDEIMGAHVSCLGNPFKLHVISSELFAPAGSDRAEPAGVLGPVPHSDRACDIIWGKCPLRFNLAGKTMTKQRSPEALRQRAPVGRARRGNRWLALAGYAGLGLACLLLGAAAFLLVAAPVDLVRDRLVQQVKSRTGRDLAVSGPASLALFPRPAISLAQVALSAPPHMGGGPTLLVEALEAELGLASLLTGQASVKRLVLRRPAIELRVDAQGQRSWDLAPDGRSSPRAAGRGPSAPAPEPAPRRDGPTRADGLGNLPPLVVAVIDGIVSYLDERSGTRHEIRVPALELTMGDGAGPLSIKGSLDWRGERLALGGTLSHLRALIEQEAARLSLRVTGRSIDASYDGALGTAGAVTLDGTMTLRAPSLQALGSLMGRPLGAGRDTGPLSLSGAIASGSGGTSIDNLAATLGETSASGALKVDGKGARPHVSGTLRLSQLDVGEILVRPRPSRDGPSGARPADPIDDLLKRDDAPGKGPQVRGFTKRAGGKPDWSDDIIDLSPLALADADLEVSADSLIYKDVKTGPTRLTLRLKSAVATLAIEDMQLYGGRGEGLLTLDGSGQVPATKAELRLDGISAQPLLKDALGLDWLEGQSRIALALAGQGVSERQIVEALSGRVEMATTNGAIDAVDVGKILRSVEQGRFSGLRSAPGDKTPFSELAGTFTIANGVAQNQDLRLVSADMRVTGSGSFNLAARSLDYTVRPKIAQVNATTERAVINLSNVEIPVRIQGSWDRPNFSVAGQEQLIETVREIGKKLKSQDVEEAIKGLLGGKGDGERVKPRDLLEKLLKKQ